MVVSYFNSRPHWYLIAVTVKESIVIGRLYLLFSMSLKYNGCKSILVFIYYFLREGINESVTIETTPVDIWLLLSLSRVSSLDISELVSMVNWLSSSILPVSGTVWCVPPRVYRPRDRRRGDTHFLRVVVLERLVSHWLLFSVIALTLLTKAIVALSE